MLHFFDTNIVLYAVDTSDWRGPIAFDLLSKHTLEKTAVVSTQALQETYHNAVRKFGVQPEEARKYVERLATLHVVDSDANFVISAISLAQTAQLSIWDSLIIAGAARAGCGVIYTEDLNHGQIISGVRIVNPFKAEGVSK